MPRVDWHLLHDETVALSCLETVMQMLQVLACLYCIANAWLTCSLLCFSLASQTFLYSCGFLQVCWLQSLTFSYSLVLLSTQVCFGCSSAGGCCGVVDALLLLNAVCLFFPFSNHERSVLSQLQAPELGNAGRSPFYSI